MKKLCNFFYSLPIYIAATALVISITIMAFNVITRYLLNFTIAGYEEIVIICFSYTVFLGGAAAYKEGMHYGIDLVVKRFPKDIQVLLQIFVRLLMISISVLLTILSWRLASGAWIKRMPATKIPYFYFDIPAVISFFLITVYSIVFLHQDIKSLFVKTSSERGEIKS